MAEEIGNLSGSYNTRVTLIQRLKDGEDNSSDWKDFVEIYQKYLYVVVRNLGQPHHDAEEIVQSVFTKVWAKLPGFEYLPTKGRFRHWLCAIAKNMSHDRMRSNNSNNKMKDNLKDDSPKREDEFYASPELAEVVDKEWKNYIANKALDEAKKQFNTTIIEVFNLHVKGKSMPEVAQDLSLAENTAYVYVKKVKDFVKERMKAMDSDWG
jgi:RNA polymerase sigma factor (sigma-70 family)